MHLTYAYRCDTMLLRCYYDRQQIQEKRSYGAVCSYEYVASRFKR